MAVDRRTFLGAGVAAAVAGTARAGDPAITEPRPWRLEHGPGMDAETLAPFMTFRKEELEN